MPLFGSHLSIAGSMVNALTEAQKLSLDTVQVFTKNQQQWKAPPLDPGVVRDWLAETERLGWRSRTVSHASYLINLASPDDELWKKSIDLMHEEIERCEKLGIPLLVHHPGAFTTSTLDAGIGRIAGAYRELFGRTAGYRTVMCLENTAGGGSTMGRTFEELARLRAAILDGGGPATPAPARVGFCFDTCHAHAAGYDMAGDDKAFTVLGAFDAACGLQNLRVLHLNDSKAAVGSRLDRHEHIGEGTIGIDGFRGVLRRSELLDRPMIMETPKGETDAGTPLDTLNLRKLKKLMPAEKAAKTSGKAAPRRSRAAAS